MPELNLTFLELVQLCDNANPFGPNSEKLVPLHLPSYPSPIGFLRPIVVEQLKKENEQSRNENQRELWVINIDQAGSKDRVEISAWADTPFKRTAAINVLCQRWRDTGLFSDVCGPTKWRSELYPIYKNPFGPHDYPTKEDDLDNLNFAFEMERSACALFGVVTYGVHMSIYQEVLSEHKSEGRELKIWVPTRAKNKQTGMTAFESLVKECMEEASITEEVVRKHARSTGAISYFFRTSAGWLQPEVEYVYALAIPPDADPALFTPKPLDGEVESFELLDQTTVIAKMKAGKFKPNCALVIIDLLIALGYLTPDNEPEFMQIVTRLHGRFDYDRW
ncbi:hypothetical protein D9757_000870 [Collybiopsis confluens]|uniref:Nudix hydrolase domain-containing protein n=1 Tax=Collybiopsis confluens TaxID=2823264 RepID=A0A8H5I0Q0_9AGAR|nr:hypothetical protein D9757_000870 [Collybiopsis confluens]